MFDEHLCYTNILQIFVTCLPGILVAFGKYCNILQMLSNFALSVWHDMLDTGITIYLVIMAV